MSNSLWPHRSYSPWNSPGENTGVGSHSLLQRIFPTQGLNPGLPHCRWILYQLSHQGSPKLFKIMVKYSVSTYLCYVGWKALQITTLSFTSFLCFFFFFPTDLWKVEFPRILLSRNEAGWFFRLHDSGLTSSSLPRRLAAPSLWILFFCVGLCFHSPLQVWTRLMHYVLCHQLSSSWNSIPIVKHRNTAFALSAMAFFFCFFLAMAILMALSWP